MNKLRSSGILLHPTSLPGKYGIGTLGREAYRFVDFLKEAKQKLWQILPLGPTGYADSPYQCFSSNAGNPLLIDLDLLMEEGLLSKQDIEGLAGFPEGTVDYGRVIEMKYPVLRKASESFFKDASSAQKAAYHAFLKESSAWLPDYSVFMAVKEHFGQKPWYQWTPALKMKDEHALMPYYGMLNDKIEFQKFLQFIFFRQWTLLKEYANKNGILIIGDIPLYIAHDSVDSWAHAEIFQFDKEKDPVAVGGVPPDYFSATGQLWGNPLFNWDFLKKQGYKWWIDRIRANQVLFDIIRIDHFRGFAGYWSVPYGEKTAINGKWIPGPGKELFEVIRKELGEVPIIAEDLGVITDDVEDLRDSFSFPGMKILQFAFDSGEANDYLPHNFTKNCVVYTGTHDNDTAMGWITSAKPEDKKYMMEYIGKEGDFSCWDLIRLAWASVADTAVIPMQDLLCLGNEARMNLPGTTSNNWAWRAKGSDFEATLAKRLAKLTELYGRYENKK
jgi:4-alpha-glucanotransferase